MSDQSLNDTCAAQTDPQSGPPSMIPNNLITDQLISYLENTDFKWNNFPSQSQDETLRPLPVTPNQLITHANSSEFGIERFTSVNKCEVSGSVVRGTTTSGTERLVDWGKHPHNIFTQDLV